MKKITVLLVETHLLLREAWEAYLTCDQSTTVCGSAPDTDETIRQFYPIQPSVILLTFAPFEKDCVEPVKKMRKYFPGAGIVVISTQVVPAVIKELKRVGVRGFVTLNSSLGEIRQAVQAAHAGQKFTCEELECIIQQTEPSPTNSSSPISQLSLRELDVIRAIKEGFSSRVISQMLGIELKTVEVHRYNILRKLGLKNSAALVNFFHCHYW